MSENKPDYFEDPQLNAMLQEACRTRDSKKIVTLIRLLGAMNDWCSDEKCGDCPFAIDGCTKDSERHVRAFIARCDELCSK